MPSIYGNIEDAVAHLPGVVAAVAAKGEEIAAVARTRLAAHRDSGNAKIEVSHGVTDTFVELVDPAAMTIEFGRAEGVDRTGRRKGRMQPLHILTGAVREVRK